MTVLVICMLLFVIAFVYVVYPRSVSRLENLEVAEIALGHGATIRPLIAHGGESFADIIDRHHPYAAINGTYYDFDMRPLGDILIDGKVVNRGCYRNAVAVTRKGKVIFLHKDQGRLNWSGCRFGVAAGPRLIHDGRIALDPVADGFSRRSLTKQALRSGIGRTKSGKLLLVASRDQLTLMQFAREMLALGAVEAMNLDGGGASGLYCNGKFLTTPSLSMSNVLLIYK